MIKRIIDETSSKKIVFLGIASGIIFWVFETLMHSLFFEKRPFFDQLLYPVYPENNELWMRMLVLITLAAFTWSARYLIIRLNRKQNALKESEKSYRTMAENLPGLVYRVLCKENNRMIFFNDMLETLTGYTADMLTAGESCSVEQLVLSEDRPKIASTIEKAISDRKSFEVEYRIRKKNGDVRYFLERGKPIFDPNGELQNIDGFIRDITEHKKSRRALEKSEKLYKDTVRYLPLHVGVTDQNGKYLVWNDNSFLIFGYSNEEVVGKLTVNDIINKNGRAQKLYEKALKQGKISLKTNLDDKNGNSFPAKITVVPIFQFDGRHTGYIELVEDFTALEENKLKIRKLSGELMKSEENQRKKLRAELHDEAGVTITATKFSCKMIKTLIERGKFNDILPYVDSITESSNKLSSELRKLYYNLSPANIDKTGLIYAVNDYVSNIKANIDLGIDVNISSSIEKNDISVKTALYRVVQEALTNVIRHANARNVAVTLNRNKGKIRLIISDDGAGFDIKTVKENVFGLKGIQQRINDLGGEFHIDSSRGRGTSLKVELPTI